MSTFRDSLGQEWRICFDAFSLADVAKETSVDLADISAGGWAKVENDAGIVGRVSAVLCREEIVARKLDPRTFAKLIRGEAIEQARAALIAEGADFFPRSEWSVIQSNLVRRREAKTQAEAIQTAMAALDGMSPDFRTGAMEAIMAAVSSGINSAHLQGSESVVGQAVTPLSVVTSGPVRSESQDAA